MSDQRVDGIAWTEHTWNPIRGCSRVSEGCRNCYAETMAARFSGPGMPYEGLTTDGRWNGQLTLVHERLGDPLRWRRPRRVFVNSMSDLFHEALTDEMIEAVFGVMASSPQHTFQVLTKRPERMRAFLTGSVPGRSLRERCFYAARDRLGMDLLKGHFPWDTDFPLPNVWLGVSVEDQATADDRIPHLLATPAAVRFVSAEPLLGPADLSMFMWPVHDSWPGGYGSAAAARADGAKVTRHRQALVLAGSAFLDWVIVGGESGHGARPCDVAWVRSIVRQCREAGSAVFVKQLGAKPTIETCHECGHPESEHYLGRTIGCQHGNGSEETPLCGCRKQRGELSHRHGDPMAFHGIKDSMGGNPDEWPADLRVREFPKEAQ